MSNTPSKDSPTVLGSIQEIQKNANELDRQPASFMTSEGRITFPDPMTMDAFESDDLLSFVVGNSSDSRAALKRWLSDEDFAKVEKEKMTRRALGDLMGKVQAYYSDVFGAPGE